MCKNFNDLIIWWQRHSACWWWWFSFTVVTRFNVDISITSNCAIFRDFFKLFLICLFFDQRIMLACQWVCIMCSNPLPFHNTLQLQSKSNLKRAKNVNCRSIKIFPSLNDWLHPSLNFYFLCLLVRHKRSELTAFNRHTSSREMWQQLKAAKICSTRSFIIHFHFSLSLLLHFNYMQQVKIIYEALGLIFMHCNKLQLNVDAHVPLICIICKYLLLLKLLSITR